MTDTNSLRSFLNKKVDLYNQPSFIQDDPVCIPHLFTKIQDIEIAAFFAAIFAWGNRRTIIRKSKELIEMMDNSPHQFIVSHEASDLKSLENFKHRTFNASDLLYFVESLKHHFLVHDSFENAFFKSKGLTVEQGLNHFKEYFFSHPHLKRTKKHISSPQQRSTCKRLNMFLRWMVRNDGKGVDFGLWKNISPAQLICPIDVHVARVARKTGLLQRKQTDWQAAVELTAALKELDDQDPVKYDFALFGLGVMEKY